MALAAPERLAAVRAGPAPGARRAADLARVATGFAQIATPSQDGGAGWLGQSHQCQRATDGGEPQPGQEAPAAEPRTQQFDQVFRAAGGRIVAALAARFRDLDLAENAFAESCLRAAQTWPERGEPTDPAAWLYRVAVRASLDALRRRQVRERNRPEPPEPEPDPEELLTNDSHVIPDERLRRYSSVVIRPLRPTHGRR